MQERRIREPRVGGNLRLAYLRVVGEEEEAEGERENRRVWPSPTRDFMAI